jgi:hypothetical protein
VAVYETEPDNYPRLMELMSDIQEYGQPPAEIIKELAPGLEFNEDGMPIMPNMGNSTMPGEGGPGRPMGSECGGEREGGGSERAKARGRFSAPFRGVHSPLPPCASPLTPEPPPSLARSAGHAHSQRGRRELLHIIGGERPGEEKN